jgi:hypothetical protein
MTMSMSSGGGGGGSGEEPRMPSSCLGRVAVPVKRVWRGLSSSLVRRRRRLSTYVPVDGAGEEEEAGGGVVAGLGRLRKEVRTCEYRDVHVMWEMLSGNGGVGGSRDDGEDAGTSTKAGTAKRRTRRKAGQAVYLVSR